MSANADLIARGSRAAVFVAVLCAIVGCNASWDAASDCSGHYSCISDRGATLEGTLSASARGCEADQSFVLAASGRVDGLGSGATWRPKPDGFEVCLADECATCTVTPSGSGGGGSGSGGGGKCHGSSRSCESMPDNCGGQLGCVPTTRYQWTPSGGEMVPYCAGTPDRCSSLVTQQACGQQAGCDWG